MTGSVHRIGAAIKKEDPEVKVKYSYVWPMIPLTFAHNKDKKGWSLKSVAVYCTPAEKTAKEILAAA